MKRINGHGLFEGITDATARGTRTDSHESIGNADNRKASINAELKHINKALDELVVSLASCARRHKTKARRATFPLRAVTQVELSGTQRQQHGRHGK